MILIPDVSDHDGKRCRETTKGGHSGTGSLECSEEGLRVEPMRCSPQPERPLDCSPLSLPDALERLRLKTAVLNLDGRHSTKGM